MKVQTGSHTPPTGDDSHDGVTSEEEGEEGARYTASHSQHTLRHDDDDDGDDEVEKAGGSANHRAPRPAADVRRRVKAGLEKRRSQGGRRSRNTAKERIKGKTFHRERF